MLKNTEFPAMKNALTFGVFDLLHFGHFELFRRIKELIGNDGKLIVLLQLDEWVSKFKDVKLVYPFEIRKQMLESLRTVDEVIPYTQVCIDSIRNIDFDLLVLGADQKGERFSEVEKWTMLHGKQVITLSRTEGISTSKLKEIIKNM